MSALPSLALTRPQFHVLAALRDGRSPYAAGSVGGRRGPISRMLLLMKERGLADRAAQGWSLTPAGRVALIEARQR